MLVMNILMSVEKIDPSGLPLLILDTFTVKEDRLVVNFGITVEIIDQEIGRVISMSDY
jgi:hypothetical protein